MPIEMKVDLDVTPGTRVTKDLERRASDMTPAFKVIGERMMDSIDRNFKEEGRPDRWEGLALATIMERMGGAGRIFKSRGGMRAPAIRKLSGMKILTRAAQLRHDMDYKAFPDKVAVGTNKIYAAVHQFGGMAGRGRKVKIPARPFIVFQKEDSAMSEREIAAFLGRG